MSRNERWALFERRINIGADEGDIYMVRWRLLRTPLFGVFLHRINRPDADPRLHDHPWSFAALVLRGGYIDQYASGHAKAQLFAVLDGLAGVASRGPGIERRFRPGHVNLVRRGECHRIDRLLRAPSWSLVLVGPRRGEWGFVLPDGWVPWRTYLGVDDPTEGHGARGLDR